MNICATERPRHSVVRNVVAAASVAVVMGATGCRHDAEPDAYGTMEATNEVVVSAEANGRLLTFMPEEGAQVTSGSIVGAVDTTQLALEAAQLSAQRDGEVAKAREAAEQVTVFEVDAQTAQRNLDRTRLLVSQHAATAQQLDQAERDNRVFAAQIAGAQAKRAGVSQDVAAMAARLAQLRDRIAKSRIASPITGIVLATYVKSGEFVQSGQPLFRVAALDTLVLRAYVTQPQLANVKVGGRVLVHADRAGATLPPFGGVVTWIASKAEFTPTPIQTRDERANLVYAIKVRVPNPTGALKIGMPADLSFAAASAK